MCKLVSQQQQEALTKFFRTADAFLVPVPLRTIHGYLVLHDQRTTSALNLPKTSVTVRIARRMLLYPFACERIRAPFLNSGTRVLIL